MSFLRPAARIGLWLAAVLLRGSGTLAWLRRRRARRGEIAVLAFHRIGGPGAPLAVPEAVFRKMLAGLTRRYRIAPWEECLRAAREGSVRPLVALSFDDGHCDAAERAWPLIRAVGGTALFFPTTSFLEGEPLWWELVAARYPNSERSASSFGAAADEEIARLKTVPNKALRERVEALRKEPTDRSHERVAPMTWSAVRRMAEEGAEFGGHGGSHAILPRCSDAELRYELEGCRETLRAQLSREVRLFAYPDGRHGTRVVTAVREAGFRYAFTGDRGVFSRRTDPLRIPRLAIDGSIYSIGGRFSWSFFEARMLGAL